MAGGGANRRLPLHVAQKFKYREKREAIPSSFAFGGRGIFFGGRGL